MDWQLLFLYAQIFSEFIYGTSNLAPNTPKSEHALKYAMAPASPRRNGGPLNDRALGSINHRNPGNVFI